MDANQNTDEIRFLPKKIVFSDINNNQIRTYTFSYDGNKIISANQKLESLSYNTVENTTVTYDYMGTDKIFKIATSFDQYSSIEEISYLYDGDFLQDIILETYSNGWEDGSISYEYSIENDLKRVDLDYSNTPWGRTYYFSSNGNCRRITTNIQNTSSDLFNFEYENNQNPIPIRRDVSKWCSECAKQFQRMAVP